jgi:predicted Zn-dependent protease
VVRLPEVDAFALPDGQLVVSESLLVQRDLSDEALAFVVAHEMAHAILQHERQLLTYGRMLLPREVPRSVQDMYVEMQFNFGMLRSLEPSLHQAEFEADEVGLLMAASAGFRPARQLEFMQNEVAEHDERRPLVSTHPAAVERLHRLEQRLPLAWRLHQRSFASQGAVGPAGR